MRNGGQGSGQGLLATAMRLVNAIPAVVAAPPGIVTPLDLTLGRSASARRAASAWTERAPDRSCELPDLSRTGHQMASLDAHDGE